VPHQHGRVAPFEAVDDDLGIVVETRVSTLERQHRGHPLVTPACELADERLPAGVVVPRAVNEAERDHGSFRPRRAIAPNS
jgi:hypothetical protein